jgi:cytosine/adenosine deaminase-related metal-dependent hydrolase
MITDSTRAGLAELLLSGCTTSADHLYVFPPGSEHFIDAQVAAAGDIGIRFHPTRGSMDLSQKDGGLPPDSVVQPIDTILADSERVIGHFHDPNPGAMVRIGLAPCSPFSVTPQLMKDSADLARRHGVRLHTHIAETMDEDAYSRATFGVSPVELLGTLSWLAPDVWVAHSVHPTEHDVAAMAGTTTGVAHCPTSNMLLGSGLAPVRQLLRAGVPVGIGVDGSASNDANDMRQEVKQAVLAARVRDGAGAMPARDALRLATRGGARVLGRNDIGSIGEGMAADLALFDITTLETAGGEEDLVAAVILGATRPKHVVVNGRVTVEDGHLVQHDEYALDGALNSASRRLLARLAAD